jgi:hypothetical protein
MSLLSYFKTKVVSNMSLEPIHLLTCTHNLNKNVKDKNMGTVEDLMHVVVSLIMHKDAKISALKEQVDRLTAQNAELVKNAQDIETNSVKLESLKAIFDKIKEATDDSIPLDAGGSMGGVTA